MIRRINVKKWNIFVLVISFLILTISNSCEKNGKEIEVESSKIVFKLSVPDISLPVPSTKSQTEEERAIYDVHVLVFDQNDELIEKIEGDNILYDNGSTSFDARLSPSEDPVTLVLIANAALSLSGIAPGDSMEDVTTSLTRNYTTSGIVTSLSSKVGLPMSGKTSLNSISADGSQDVSVKMLRSIARADVIVEAGNFELVDARIYRGNSLIQLLPTESTENNIDWTNPSATVPSVPSTSGLSVNNTTPIGADAQNNNIVAKLYLPEAEGIESGDGSISIIVGGYYNGSPDLSYYRIDFRGGVSGHPYGQILRNHKYIFNIKGVYNQGWSTPDLAANNEATDVEVQVVKWNEYTKYMEFDGKHYLGVSSREVISTAHKGDIQSIIVETSYSLSDLKLQWYDNLSGNVTGTPATSLEDDRFKVTFSQDNGNIIINVESKEGNTSPTDAIYEYFSLVTDHFQIPITMRQNSLGYDQSVRVWSRGTIGATGSGSTPGMDNILKNADNFGNLDNSKVRLDEIEFNHNSGSYAFDATADIVDLAYNADFGASANRSTNAQAILDWHAGKDYRFLKISPESSAHTSSYLLPLLWGNVDWSGWSGGMTTAQYISDYWVTNILAASVKLSFETVDATNSFILGAGAPFGEVLTDDNKNNYYSPVDGTFGLLLQNPDGTFGPPGFTFIPLVTTTVSSKKYMSVGIDIQNRILFVGDGSSLQQKSSITGSAGTDFRIVQIGTITGVVSSDSGYEANRLYANIWAYIIGDVVVPGKIHEEVNGI